MKVMVVKIGALVTETSSSGNQVQRSHVILADETTAMEAILEAKTVPKAGKTLHRNTALR